MNTTNQTVRRTSKGSSLSTFLRDTRGQYVEYIVLIAIALACLAGWKTFKAAVAQKNQSQGQQVQSVSGD